MPAALQATGPRKPRSIGSGEKSPSNSSPCASADSVSGESGGLADASVLLTCASDFRIELLRRGRENPSLSSLRVIPRSALHRRTYVHRSRRVNDHGRRRLRLWLFPRDEVVRIHLIEELPKLLHLVVFRLWNLDAGLIENVLGTVDVRSDP